MLDQFNTTIGKIYAAAGDPAAWGEALNAIENLTGSVGAVIGFVPKTVGDAGFNLAGRFTAEQCATYTAEYQPICPRTRYMIEHRDRSCIYDAMVLTEREMDSDPVYDWFGRHGLRYFIGCELVETKRYASVFSLQRSPAQGHVQKPDIEMFKLLAPHVARAVALADQLGTLKAPGRFTSAVLEVLPQAVLALDGSGVLLFANSAGEAVLAAGDGLYVEHGRLRSRLASDQAPLDRAIADAASAIATGDSWVRVSSSSRPTPYALFVAPVRVADDSLSAEAKVLVIVHDTGRQAAPGPDVLMRLYSLTEAEARLASALSLGHSLESAAALLGIRKATAKTELKAVFRKVGAHRQQDLMRVLSPLSMISPTSVISNRR